MKISRKKLKQMYRMMMQTRKFEEKAAYLFSLGQVHGTAHFCVGEEAAGVGASCALAKQDLVYVTHRGHGQCIGKGMDINRMMAEFLGKETGYCKGKGGCMHIAGLDVGNLGSNGIVGAGLPIAVGAALSTRMQSIDRVVLCFFGDGATNEGAFHEALNLASIWQLPIIFLCVNNQYGMSMSVKRSMNIDDISIRGSAYGIPGEPINGNDICEVYSTVKRAVAYVKKHGPKLIVCNTYRIMGHSKSDANVYRTKAEVDAWKKKCPIKALGRYLIKNKIFSKTQLDAIEKEAAADIESAVAYAQQSPYPSVDTIFDDVYA
ncbi:MAG: thiamine pyrophosphate-dependent dehydrogenase E1 component subunit alpha [bacterium]|nr:thiamine pyrophosphate-dependent dehydrogenase E1 component subunit alpha [bacterium]